jgi:hypothetical protein
MTCTVTDKAGGSCRGVKPDGQHCDKVLYPPHNLPHVVYREPVQLAHGGVVLEPQLYCDDCCPVHKGQRPLTTSAWELIQWLTKADPATLTVRGWMDEQGQPALVLVERIRDSG